MLPKEQPDENTKVEIDWLANAILLTRVYSAPPKQVFDAWTQPEHLRCWWDPTGRPLAICEIDLRPGGAFRFVNQANSGSHEFAGVYREIVRPKSLIFEAMGAIGHVILDEIEGKTQLTVKIKCGSASKLEQYLQRGIDAGTAKTLDNLAVHLTNESNSPRSAVRQSDGGAR